MYFDYVNNDIKDTKEGTSLLSSEITTLTKTFVLNEEYDLTLLSPSSNPVITVQKEVASAGSTATKSQFATDANYQSMEIADYAYAVGLTLSATQGSATATLASGSWSADDVGRAINVGGGIGVIDSVNVGDAQITIAVQFDGTSYPAGWALNEVVIQDGVMTVSGYALPTEYYLEGATYVREFADASIFFSEATFNPDGTKLYTVSPSTDSIYQYTVGTGFDLSTATTVGKVTIAVGSVDNNMYGLTFSNDGTKMFLSGTQNSRVYQYSVSPAFDLGGTVTYDSVYLASSANGEHVAFNSDGTTLFVNDLLGKRIKQYSLSVGFDLASTVTYQGQVNPGSLAAVTDGSDRYVHGFAFNSEGTKLFVCLHNNTLYQFSVSTPFNVLSGVTYDGVSFPTTSQLQTVSFNPDGSKMYVVSVGSGNVARIREHNSVGSDNTFRTGDYVAAIASTTVSRFWTDLDSVTTTDTVNSEFISYAFSTDGRTTWFVTDATGNRNVVRNNAGTWEYNSNVTFAAETWTAATVNTELAALEEAQSVVQNNLTPTTLNALTDAQLFTLADSLDLAVVLRTDTTAATPTFQDISYDYESLSLYEMAVNGTDYSATQGDAIGSNVIIKALAANNLKVKVD